MLSEADSVGALQVPDDNMAFDIREVSDKKVAVVGEMSIAALMNDRFNDNQKQIGRRGTYQFMLSLIHI